MPVIRGVCGAAAAAIAAASAGNVQAAVVISRQPTQNMSCADGVCQPVAAHAVLNTGDLETLLAAGNLKVTTKGAGVQAKTIRIADGFGWSTPNALSLVARHGVEIAAAVAVQGEGSLAIDTGADGALVFRRKGRIGFADTASGLSINGWNYTLESSLKALAQAIANDPSGSYALSGDYDAGNDGTYSKAPVRTALRGRFEGLGNTVSRLTIAAAGGNVGLFAYNLEGWIGDISVRDAAVAATKGTIGAVVGYNAGELSGAHATGSVTADGHATVGGLVGANTNRGAMTGDDADVAVLVGANSSGGGLAGDNSGPISQCFARGRVKARAANAEVGGLVGRNSGSVENAYARGAAVGAGYAGGLIGYNELGVYTGRAASSYSTGKVKASQFAGGLIGVDDSKGEYLGDTYWDTTTSRITDPAQGAGSPPNDPGITPLTTTELQSGLPNGFDASVWAQSPNINDGLPYLVSDPPQ